MDQLPPPYDDASLANPQPEPTAHPARNRYRRRLALVTAAAVLLPLLAGFTGYGLGNRSAAGSGLLLHKDDGCYLPVESKTLTVSVTPLEPGPRALSAYNRPDSTREHLAWDLCGPGLERALPRLAELYPVQFKLGETLVIPDEFFVADQQQYRADLVLDWLVEVAAEDSFRTIGVLPVDIYQPDFNYLFGLARLGGTACIASSSRMGMNSGGDSFLADERWQSILRHELGHTLGLRHVADRCSVMCYSNCMEQLDMTGQSLTASDWALLQEMHPLRWDRW